MDGREEPTTGERGRRYRGNKEETKNIGMGGRWGKRAVKEMDGRKESTRRNRKRVWGA